MNIHKIYALPLSSVFVIMAVAVVGFAAVGVAVYVGKNKTVKRVFSEINGILAAAVFAAVLFYTVIGRTGVANPIGFIRTLEQIRAQRELIREMVMNVFLFFPLGLTMPYALPQRAKKPFAPAVITVAGAFSCTCIIELLQFLFGLGNAELSDIIMNTLGAALGTLSFCLKNAALRFILKVRKHSKNKGK